MASRVTVEVEDLQERLEHYLSLVQSGTEVSISDEGRPIARIVPTAMDEEEVRARAMAMVRAGLAHWNGERLQPHRPAATLIGDKTVADLLLEDRG